MAAREPPTCPECDAPLAERSTETVCTDCGLVVTEHRIDPGPEWRSFENEETDRRRTGAPLSRSRHDHGLSTEIGYESPNRTTGRKRRLYARLRKQHKRAQCDSKAQINQRDVFMQIRRVVSTLELPESVTEQACALFRSAQNEGIVQGRSLEGFTAATVYAACRVLGIPRLRGEILDASHASRGELDCAYDAMNRELGLPIGPLDPAEYVPRFGCELELCRDLRARATELLESATENELVGGHNPAGVAAACLYAAAGERDASLTQKEAADVAGVTPPTIRVTYQALCEAELVG
ncbi:MAG: transcription initiation factor IIB family protein [Halalkalicoccus sp.]